VTGYIGYTRVSTLKQGTKGVSLSEQRDAILRYAERQQLSVTTWLEETETAAKQGRPVFMQAMKMLRSGKTQGIILHKLDRGARNLRDWVAIGELSDQGAEIHFVNESLDLQSRGGRLSADIQAVVAADYIRNLREETRKGFYGRLKQGLYPLRAPVGYLDEGKGQSKTIDPIMGPLVRQAFELYGSGRHSLETLGEEMHRLGLRNHNGGRVTRNGLSTLLNNPFYVGLIRIRKTSETFAGVHPPLIGKTLFDRVQAVLHGKVFSRTQRHAFEFRRMLTCATCRYSLVGERQKGHVYYRCHGAACQGTSIREEAVQSGVGAFLKQFEFSEAEKNYFRARVMKLRETWADQREEEARSLKLRLDQVKDRLNRLTDAYLDRDLDKPMFEERRTKLLFDQKSLEEMLRNLGRPNDRMEKYLELAVSAGLSHQMANPEEKRELLKILTSNRVVFGKKLELEPSLPFREIANRHKNQDCDQQRDAPRTWDRILEVLSRLNTSGDLPDFSFVAGFEQLDVEGSQLPPNSISLTG
jgi:site-specific DNA recombinase